MSPGGNQKIIRRIGLAVSGACGISMPLITGDFANVGYHVITDVEREAGYFSKVARFNSLFQYKINLVVPIKQIILYGKVLWNI